MRSVVEESHTGWVYRSDPGPAVVEPAPAEALTPEVLPAPGRWEPSRPVVPAAASTGRGWIASGLYLMALPVAITAGIMLAPLVWAFSGRDRR